jgi:hypothetical protein
LLEKFITGSVLPTLRRVVREASGFGSDFAGETGRMRSFSRSASCWRDDGARQPAARRSLQLITMCDHAELDSDSAMRLDAAPRGGDDALHQSPTEETLCWGRLYFGAMVEKVRVPLGLHHDYCPALRSRDSLTSHRADEVPA